MRSEAVLEAPAKVNLYLEAGPLRPDGYHPVRTVLQTVELCDLVEMEVTVGGEGVRLAVDGVVQHGEDNLCYRAASVFIAATRMRMGIDIRLSKRIPQAAGLGGGSSDAAAVLRMLNFYAGEAMTRERLMQTAASLGMDVPYFLVGGTALGEGRGERIKPLPQAPPLPVLLVNPGIALSTSEVYRRFDLSGGDDPPAQGPGTLLSLLPAADAEMLAPLLHNSLQRAACELNPEVGDLLQRAAEAGAASALVSGSGPTVFILARSDEEAVFLEEEMMRHAPIVIRTRFRMAGVSQV